MTWIVTVQRISISFEQCATTATASAAETYWDNYQSELKVIHQSWKKIKGS